MSRLVSKSILACIAVYISYSPANPDDCSVKRDVGSFLGGFTEEHLPKDNPAIELFKGFIDVARNEIARECGDTQVDQYYRTEITPEYCQSLRGAVDTRCPTRILP